MYSSFLFAGPLTDIPCLPRGHRRDFVWLCVARQAHPADDVAAEAPLAPRPPRRPFPKEREPVHPEGRVRGAPDPQPQDAVLLRAAEPLIVARGTYFPCDMERV